MNLIQHIEKLTTNTLEPVEFGAYYDGKFISPIKLKTVAAQLLACKHFKPQFEKPIKKIDGVKAIYLVYKNQYNLTVNKDGYITYDLISK